MSETVNTYTLVMARWAPDTRNRLAKAALELYLERGYDQTTVAGIAALAGTTERTFFRHFTDKSEVLFGGNTEFQEIIVGTLLGTPSSTRPIEAVCTGLKAAGKYFQGSTAPFLQRQTLIASRPELTSRELHKMATLGTAIAAALQERGVQETEAGLTAEAGIVIFRKAYERWLSGEETDWAQCVQQTRDALRAVICGGETNENA